MSDHLNEGKRKDGKKHGKWIRYYVNGNKREEGKYAEGRKEGRWTRYHKDGSRAVVCHYENDIYTGEITAYWPDGNLKQIGQFNSYAGKWSDGKKTGSWTYYAEDGETIWCIITYKNGSRTKEDDKPLGSCRECDYCIQSPAWKICPKCGTDLIKCLG